MKVLKLTGLLSLLVLVSVFFLIPLTSCGEGREEKAASGEAGESAVNEQPDVQSLLQDRCTRCHNLSRVNSARKDTREWTETVSRMIGKGAVLNDNEKAVLIKFLSKE